MNDIKYVLKDQIHRQERMVKLWKQVFCLLLLICSVYVSFAQDAIHTIAVKASIDKNAILIGEPIRLNLEAELPDGVQARWFPLDTLPHFEFIEQQPIDTSDKPNWKLYRQTVTITSFDSGSWTIPAMALEVDEKLYMTDSLPVTVSFSEFDPSRDYHDIKDIFEVDNPNTKYINWAIAAITLLSLLALVYFLRKRKEKTAPPVIKPVIALPPLEDALRQLEELKKQDLPRQGQSKVYYSRLNEILKLFISRKSTASVEEKTNDEVTLLVKQSGMPHNDLISLAQTLRLSDAVKFAKFVPVREDDEKSFETIRTSIESLNNLYK
jgi:hypothetical protein